MLTSDQRQSHERLPIPMWFPVPSVWTCQPWCDYTDYGPWHTYHSACSEGLPLIVLQRALTPLPQGTEALGLGWQVQRPTYLPATQDHASVCKSPNKTPFTNKCDWSGLFLGFSAPSAFGGRVAYVALSWNRRQCSTSRSRTIDLAEHGRWSRGLLSRTSLSTALLHSDRSHAGWMALPGALFTLRVLTPYALPLFC